MSSPSANGRLLLLTFQSRVTKCSKRTRQGRFCCSFPWKLDCAIKSTGRLCKAASPFPWRRTRCSAPRCSPLDLANVTKAKPRSPWLYWNRIKTRMEKSAEHLLASISTSFCLSAKSVLVSPCRHKGTQQKPLLGRHLLPPKGLWSH